MRHALAEAGIERVAAVNEPGGRRFLLALLGLLVLAGALRVGALAANPSIVPIGDERTYVETAVNIASGAGHVFGPHGTRAGWPPAPTHGCSPSSSTRTARDRASGIARASVRSSRRRPFSARSSWR